MSKKKILIITVLSLILLVIIPLLIFYFSQINITLIGPEKVTINLNDSYSDPGVKSNLLFFKVKNIKVENNINNSLIGEYKIIYTAKFLNKSKSIERIITVTDGKVPTITLLGDKEIKLYVNSIYEEAGYEAVDDTDGDLTSKVIIKNEIDLSTPGNYKVIYEVEDSHHNQASVERSVEVMPRPVKNAPYIPVLMYHFFYDSSLGEKGRDGNWTEAGAFEEQIKYLVDNNYYFPTWDEVIDYIDGKTTLPEKSVVITFDDGDLTFFKHAAPIITKYKVRATSFIIGEYAPGDYMQKYPNIYYESHTYKMHRGGCEGINHGGLFNCISYDAGLKDLKTSIEICGDNKAIAYPFGDVNSNVKKITADAGIKLGFTTVPGKVKPGMDKLELPRVRISGGITLEEFINRL